MDISFADLDPQDTDSGLILRQKLILAVRACTAAVQAGIGGGSGGTTGYLTADQATTNAAAVNVTNMSFAIPANEVWAVEFRLGTTVSGAAGMKIAITVPAGATLGASVRGSSTAIITASGTLTANIQSSATGPVTIHALIQNGANAGNVQLQFASGDGVVTATIKGGQTYFTARKLA